MCRRRTSPRSPGVQGDAEYAGNVRARPGDEKQREDEESMPPARSGASASGSTGRQRRDVRLANRRRDREPAPGGVPIAASPRFPSAQQEQRQLAQGRRRPARASDRAWEPRGQFRGIDPREAPAHRVERNHGATTSHSLARGQVTAMALFQLVLGRPPRRSVRGLICDRDARLLDLRVAACVAATKRCSGRQEVSASSALIE